MVIQNTKRYAIIENGKVANIVIADDEFANSQGWINVDNIFVDIGYLYDGSSFLEDPKVKKERLRFEKLERDVLEKRAQLLEETDFWEIPDYKPTQEQLDYRQALRDVLEQEGFPENVVWPEKPE